eukprot:CAMPEP_0180534356 /NCGR_PEP_ID=MMETSP1036_2-20121128/64127_1 /TAXON_ID=632150 /ORGANISM="Azadinium spinosum, Strain 3D9" /LENGTH=985 /DNA_ID=CAMNT_0022548655 /DNA_START=35 /DNA_END=2992 /DNA_ORIENTATION=-
MYGIEGGKRQRQRIRRSPGRSVISWTATKSVESTVGCGCFKLVGVDVQSLTVAVVAMPDATSEEVIINPSLGPMTYRKDMSQTALTYNESGVAGPSDRGWGGGHINKKWLAMSRTEQEVLIVKAAKQNRGLRIVMGEEWYEYVQRNAIIEKMRSVMMQLAEKLSSPQCAKFLEDSRGKSENFMQFARATTQAVIAAKQPTYSYFGVDDGWLKQKVMSHAEEPWVLQTYNHIQSLTSYGKLGPLQLEKGVVVLVKDLPGVEGTKLNGNPVILRNWDPMANCYIVSPWSTAEETIMVPATSLQVAEGRTFSTVEEAFGFVNELYQAYGSEFAGQVLSKLASVHPRFADYMKALPAARLEVEKSVLEKFDFAGDACGQFYSLRAMAEFEARNDFVGYCNELQRFGFPDMDFTGRVAIVTGGGRGLGRSYCLLLAAKGCKVVCNNRTKEKADEVVTEIKSKGGEAVADYSDVASAGDKIFDTAIAAYGKVDIILMNAGQLEDTLFLAMKLEQFQTIQDTHLFGHVKLMEKAWPHLVERKYGRIIVTSSTSGCFGNFGQLNYGTVKFGLTSFGQTLAMEGFKHNIQTNIICIRRRTRPLGSGKACIRLPPHTREARLPQPVACSTSFLLHEKCEANGLLWYVEGGECKPCRFQADESFVEYNPKGGPSQLESVAAQWGWVAEFKKASYPGQKIHAPYMPVPETDHGDENLEGRKPSRPPVAKELRFDGRVAVVQGGGSEIGRSVALLLGARGAKVIVNDREQEKADKVVSEITKAGGSAIADYSDCGDKAVDLAVDQFDRLDIVVAADKKLPGEMMFDGVTSEQFISSYNSHVTGTFKIMKKAWMQFYDPRYGRIVMITSKEGFHGSPGQAINGAKTGALCGMSQILAMEGSSQGIFSNAIATEGTDYDANAIAVAFLCHESCRSSAQMYQVEGGHVTSLRWQMDEDFIHFDGNRPGPEAVKEVCAKFKDKIKWEQTSYPAFMLHMSYRR